MPKILYVSYVRPGGGDWVHTREFLAALSRLHPEVAAHLPRISEKHGQSSGSKSMAPDPLREIRYAAGMVFTRLGEQLRVLQQAKPDLVIFRACRYTSLIFLCRALRIPIVLEVNAPMLERKFLSQAENFRGLPFWCRLEAHVFAAANHLLVVSDVLKDYYIHYGLSAGKITTVPNGVDLSRFHPAVDGRGIRKMLGLENKLVIGFSGSFTPWHGFDFLAESAQELIGLYPQWKDRVALLLVGAARDKVKQAQDSRVSMTITGQVPHSQMPAYLAAMDIIVAPYPAIQPFYFSPLKIVEAMAMGRPVIASAQGQIKWLIQDQESGLLYAPGDRPGFINKLAALLENPEMRARLGQNAFHRIAAGLTWQHNAERILGICKHLINKQKPRR